MYDTDTYNIYRYYQKDGMRKKLQKSGLTLTQAQEYCDDLETSSKTAEKGTMGCKSEWFDGFEKN